MVRIINRMTLFSGMCLSVCVCVCVCACLGVNECEHMCTSVGELVGGWVSVCNIKQVQYFFLSLATALLSFVFFAV